MVRMFQCHKGTFLQRENQLFMWRELYTQVLALQENSFKWVNQSHLRIQYLVNKLLPGVRFLDCIRLLDVHQKLLPAKWRAAVQSWLAGHARIVPQIVHQRITSKLVWTCRILVNIFPVPRILLKVHSCLRWLSWQVVYVYRTIQHLSGAPGKKRFGTGTKPLGLPRVLLGNDLMEEWAKGHHSGNYQVVMTPPKSHQLLVADCTIYDFTYMIRGWR